MSETNSVAGERPIPKVSPAASINSISLINDVTGALAAWELCKCPNTLTSCKHHDDYYASRRRLETHIAELESSVSDSRRLDWLNKLDVRVESPERFGAIIETRGAEISLREAIDEAMKSGIQEDES